MTHERINSLINAVDIYDIKTLLFPLRDSTAAYTPIFAVATTNALHSTQTRVLKAGARILFHFSSITNKNIYLSFIVSPLARMTNFSDKRNTISLKNIPIVLNI